ncbi:MAG: chloride channel protein, partial [Calditrichaeota bacterium]
MVTVFRRSWLRLQSGIFSERGQHVAAALSVGVMTSLGVLLFKRMIVWVDVFLHRIVEAGLGRVFPWWPVLLPVIGGALVGAMRYWFIAREKHHGVASIMAAVAFSGGRLPYQRIPAKILGSAISIGSGASVGPEDPSVQIGAGIGSMLGQLFHMSERRIQVLVATGAASGIATAFNAPIAGVFFAMELVLGEYESGAFGMMMLSSVTAAVITRGLLGPSPAFPIPAYQFHGAHELPFYLVLGVLAAVVALAYIRALYLAHDWFHESRIPEWLRPILVGGVLGILGLYVPQILGDGHEATGEILRGLDLVPHILIMVLALKLILTALSMGSGFIGGVFAPSLLLGAALGGAFGTTLTHLFPAMPIEPSAFALVGMAAVLAGAVRAPGTAIMLLFEMTNDYRIFLPLMFAVVVSMFISELLEPESVYTLGLSRKGIRLLHGRDVDVMQALSVRDVMDAPPALVYEDMPLLQVSHLFNHSRSHGLPVLDGKEHLIGVISVTDVENALQEDPANLNAPAGNFCSRRLLVTYPDECVQEALQRMGTFDVGRLPVVERNRPRHLVGWINREAIIRAYKLALLQRVSQRHHATHVRMEA